MQTKQERVAAAFLFAIETAMRAGEICMLRWGDIDDGRKLAHVRAVDAGAKKTGNSRVVPLSVEAIRIVEQLRGIDSEFVFALSVASLDANFRKAKRKAIIGDLHFHDSRAEALTRLSKRYDVMKLAQISGHKDIRILHEVYYRETVEDWWEG